MKKASCVIAISILVWVQACENKPAPGNESTSVEQRSSLSEKPLPSREEFLSCWYQSWKDGEWKPLANEPDPTSYTYCEPDPYRYTHPEGAHGRFYLSMCKKSQSIRVINPDEQTYRILSKASARIPGFEYDWGPGIYASTLDKIEEGYALFVIYKNKMYAILITTVLDAFKVDDAIAYSFATVDSGGVFPARVSWKELAWVQKTTERELPLADRTIRFRTGMGIVNNKLTGESYVSIAYDNYYGCYGGPPNYPEYPDPARIAIVDREYLEENDVVDIYKFRFKTWEDGLGNRCEECFDE